MSLFGGKKESYKDKKSLVIYFSRADENYNVGYITKGNTEYIAEFVRDITNADLFKVEPLVPYSKDYNTCIQEAKQRVGNAPIKENIKDISSYEVIYIMTPIYWGTYAPELETALKELDFTGKTIRIVTTHEGSGNSGTFSDIKNKMKSSNVNTNGLAIQGKTARQESSRSTVENWLKELGF